MLLQLSSTFHLLRIWVTLAYLSCTLAIRVDWNTNHGPIVPPTSTIAPVPQPPFRAPAPVWEDQSDDIPNPNQYKYVAPPPSRPRYNNPDATPSTNLASTGITSTAAAPTTPVYGTILSHPNQLPVDNSKSVSSLAVKFIPNYGNKYVAIVPTALASKTQYLSNNNIYDNYQKYDQFQKYNQKNDYYNTEKTASDRYTEKLRKYKAYEQQKVKYVPYFLYNLPKQQYMYFNQPQAAVAKQWSPNGSIL